MALKDDLKKRMEEAKNRAKLFDADKLLDAATKGVGGMLTKTEEEIRKGTQQLTKAVPANTVPDRTEKMDPNPANAKTNENTAGLKVQPKIAQGVGSSAQPGPLNASPAENTNVSQQDVEKAQPAPVLAPGPQPKHAVPELKPK